MALARLVEMVKSAWHEIGLYGQAMDYSPWEEVYSNMKHLEKRVELLEDQLTSETITADADRNSLDNLKTSGPARNLSSG